MLKNLVRMLQVYSLGILLNSPASAMVLDGIGLAEQGNTLNIVTYQQQAEEWVTAHSAKIQLSVHVTTQEKNFAAVQKRTLNKLEQLSGNNPWHIYNFTKTQDQSGLETLNWELGIRLPLPLATKLKEKIAKLSQPGEQYTVNDLDFQPSLEEKQAIVSGLRQKIYTQITTELKNLNKSFAPNRYFLHKVTFSTPTSITSATPLLGSSVRTLPSLPNSTSLLNAEQGSDLILTAEVELATIVRR